MCWRMYIDPAASVQKAIAMSFVLVQSWPEAFHSHFTQDFDLYIGGFVETLVSPVFLRN